MTTRDKRPVGDLSIQELERVLAMRRREERMKQRERLKREGRMVDAPNVASEADEVFDLTPPEPRAPAPKPVDPVIATAFEGSTPLFEDDPLAPPMARSTDNGAWKRFVNSALLLVEVAAVAGLIFIGVSLFQSIGKLETETRAAAELADQQRRAGIPTIAPTPQVTLDAVVLPGGHTFTASGAPQFNYSEIPSSLLPMVQDQLIAPPPRRAAPTDETALQLIVPKLNVNQTIVQGVDWDALRLGIGQLTNGTNPDADDGNIVLAAHDDIYGEYFRHLDQLAPGDQFQIQTRSRVYTYTVTGSEIVDPTDVHVMDKRGGSTATLISCYPYQVNSHRIVVYATRNT
jgi:sortase A